MTLAPGDRVGPYDIISLLGAGGMGEVYRARDGKLGRDVAIKVLPASLTDDADRVARFEREARVLAALNHPNVGTIYGLEEFAGGRALVLELVEGPTLADRIRRSPVPVREALRICGAIAHGVDAAHKKGIVHRDLKPANIKITPEGTIKVLDFGLAKITDPQARDGSPAATTVLDATRAGAVMGTAGYMSPEQARGDAVDARTDIWAIGCILYETLTGRRAFDGRTASDMIAGVLEREPDWLALPRGTPSAARDLLKRCLAKAPNERLQEMADVRARIELSLAGETPKRFGRTAALALTVAGVASLATLATGWLRSGSFDSADSAQWERLTDFPDSAVQPALSRDGRMLAFIRGEQTMATTGQIYLKHLPGGDATPLTRDNHLKMDPVFSPDGRRIAYTVLYDAAKMDSGWDTWEVPVVRGEPRRWLANAASLTWIRPDALLFSRIKRGNHMGIVTASETGAGVRELYYPANEARMVHRSSQSPDGQWVLTAEMDERGVFTPCRLIPAGGGSSGRIVGPAAGPCTTVAWAPDGRQMYFSVDTGQGMHLWRQRFPDGAPEQLTAGTTTQEEGLAIAPDGRSVISSVGQQRRGVWLHTASGERQISLEGYAYGPLLSVDGRTLVFRVSQGAGGGRTPTELWMSDLTSGRFERIFPGQLVVQYDLSRDDQVVAAVVEADESARLWVAWLDGREPPRRLGIEASSARFGANGEIFFVANEGGENTLFRTDVGGAPPRRLTSEPAGGVVGAVSPDGLWVSDNLGAETRAVSTIGRLPVPILRSGVARLRWTPDGKHALLAVQSGAGPSAFGFGRTYVLPLEAGEMLPRTPPGGFASDEEVAAQPGVQTLPYGDLAFGPDPGTYVFSKITVTRNLYRIPLP